MPVPLRNLWTCCGRSADALRRCDRVPDRINYFKAAFFWQYNLILLAGATALSLISRSPLPMMLAGGVELMYLSVVPNNARFQRMVRAQLNAEQRRARAIESNTLFRGLPIELQSRFDEVARVCRDIRTNYASMAATTQWIAS